MTMNSRDLFSFTEPGSLAALRLLTLLSGCNRRDSNQRCRFIGSSNNTHSSCQHPSFSWCLFLLFIVFVWGPHPMLLRDYSIVLPSGTTPCSAPCTVFETQVYCIKACILSDVSFISLGLLAFLFVYFLICFVLGPYPAVIVTFFCLYSKITPGCVQRCGARD